MGRGTNQRAAHSFTLVGKSSGAALTANLQHVKSPSAISSVAMAKLSHNTQTFTSVKAAESQLFSQIRDLEQTKPHFKFFSRGQIEYGAPFK